MINILTIINKCLLYLFYKSLSHQLFTTSPNCNFRTSSKLYLIFLNFTFCYNKPLFSLWTSKKFCIPKLSLKIQNITVPNIFSTFLFLIKNTNFKLNDKALIFKISLSFLSIAFLLKIISLKCNYQLLWVTLFNKLGKKNH